MTKHDIFDEGLDTSRVYGRKPPTKEGWYWLRHRNGDEVPVRLRQNVSGMWLLFLPSKLVIDDEPPELDKWEWGPVIPEATVCVALEEAGA